MKQGLFISFDIQYFDIDYFYYLNVFYYYFTYIVIIILYDLNEIILLY